MKLLFVFFEGLPSTVIESQVLLHCKRLKRVGIDCEIITFAMNTNIYKEAIERLEYAKEISDCKVHLLKGFRAILPFSESLNALILNRYIKENDIKYDLIHARTDYSADVASLITDNFIWDCRGDTLAEFENLYSSSYNILGKIYKKYKIARNIKRAKRAKRAIFVSTFLKNKLKYEKEFYIIGCMADEELFFYSEKLRERKRKELNILDSDKVLVYSGSISYYQMFPQIVDLFKSLDNSWKFLILTNHIDIAKKYLKSISSHKFILKSAKFKEVNSYLNASDVGIILREKDDLNRSASPTKYAEYSMAGLPIIYSDDIGDLESYNHIINNRIKRVDLKNIKYSIKLRESISLSAKKILSKKEKDNLYKKIYEIG